MREIQKIQINKKKRLNLIGSLQSNLLLVCICSLFLFFFFLPLKYVPSGNVFRRVTPLLLLVVNSTVAATLFAWCNPIQAYVKLLTIVGMRKFWMIDRHTSAIQLTLLRTLETVLQFLIYHSASLKREKEREREECEIRKKMKKKKKGKMMINALISFEIENNNRHYECFIRARVIP